MNQWSESNVQMESHQEATLTAGVRERRESAVVQWMTVCGTEFGHIESVDDVHGVR